MTAATPAASGSARRAEWRGVAKAAGVYTAVTGMPCIAIAVYFSDPSIVFDWLHVSFAFVLLLCVMTGMWVATVYPVLLVLGWILSRGDPPGPRPDADGPGVIV